MLVRVVGYQLKHFFFSLHKHADCVYTIHRQECRSLLSEETFRISRRTKVNSTYCTLKALPPVSQHYTFTAKPLWSGWDECFTCFKEDLLCFLVFPFHMQMYVETVTVLDAHIKHSQSFHITRSVHVEVIPVSPKLRLQTARFSPTCCSDTLFARGWFEGAALRPSVQT